MSTQRVNDLGETKGQEIQRELMALLTPTERERMDVLTLKDTNMLTKTRISLKLTERSGGGTGEIPLP